MSSRNRHNGKIYDKPFSNRSESRKGRTFDFFFCPFCGNKYRNVLMKCPMEACHKRVIYSPKCGNCHLPQENPDYTFCRLCGLKYVDVGIIFPMMENPHLPLPQ